MLINEKRRKNEGKHDTKKTYKQEGQQDLNEEHKISICRNGGRLPLSGLVKHDDSDTA